ncbi:MAG: YlxR family protein [Candidatus Dormibacteria bacterium]
MTPPERDGDPNRMDHVPLRTCVGCRRRRPRPELVRLVAGAAGAVILDTPARAPGRGAYLCRDSGVACLRAAQKRRSLSRSLRVRENDIDPETLGLQLSELTEEERS